MAVRLLNRDTIGKIAAGEVVERPASVVKELVENALDAGARRISVQIRGGGSELIEIADDGCGMTADDLTLAIERHATSKLTRFDDLDVLQTLGFRGEALPSIGAVSSFSIRTRTSKAVSGAAVEVEFGETTGVRLIAAPLGTTVTVRDLFGNVPARRKFLRQATTETSYIGRVIAAYAAAYPMVRFQLLDEGRRVVSTDGAGDPVAAAAGAFGIEVGAAVLPLEPLEDAAAVPGIEVSGWVGAPTVTRSHRQGLVFFVNGRWIQNRALAFALEEAYHSLLLVGRHPVALVHVRLDPAAVDVNVHPTKAEVKFVDERSVCRAVQRAAHGALARSPHDVMPRVSFEGASLPARQPTMPLPPTQFARFERTTTTEGQSGPTDAAEFQQSGVPILRVLGQVSATYIIAEGPHGMYLIDQHAAHERVLYEQILSQLKGRVVDRQPLLDPLTVDLAPDELAVVEKSVEELRAIGFEIEPFGNGSVVVRSVPALMRSVDIGERLHLILRELADGGTGDSWLDSVAISTACHTSIRAGQSLSLAEMRELVHDLERAAQPRACGHGRPTMLHLTQSELERQFARR